MGTRALTEFSAFKRLTDPKITKSVGSLPFGSLVPAIGEIVKGYEASVWYGIAGPKGIPPKVVETLNKAVAAALADPKMKARFADLGGTPMPMSPAEFGKLVADETEKWAVVVKSAGLSVE